ncbi:DUF3592 domain-containing protein [Gilvimarinus agarilyticus]|uniref:DUF3592 domain-containing protein n=1 Tax=Gilvimarinus agarilyticus TaxID=679259 RepID=UPI00059FCDF7|nr:DUF3592 domain-containing protein [Gilvimarinus agarilyticus]
MTFSLVASVYLVASSVVDGFKSYSVYRWDTVQGYTKTSFRKGRTIISLTRNLHNSEGLNTFTYSYRYKGTDYQSTFTGFGFNRPEKHYKAGVAFAVYVNPNSPTKSALEAGIGRPHIVGFLFGLFFLAISYYLNKKI